jgi:saccharopine dehydrogenase-like NADP-dependent oxidoreductase
MGGADGSFALGSRPREVSYTHARLVGSAGPDRVKEDEMRILVVGSGGVGASLAPIAARRDFYERIVFADYDETRARTVVERYDQGRGRFSPARVDASNPAEVTELCQSEGITHVLNAVDPRFVMPIFDGAFEAGVTYLDMAMSLSHPHPEKPHELPGVKLGDEQFEKAAQWEDRGQLALVGMGVEPGISDVFARYAQDHLFSSIEDCGVRDGANLVVHGYDFAPGFSIWTTIEECLNPPAIWEKDRGWYTTPPFSEPETFTFPEGIGPVECVNVEHEEVLLIPRWIDCKRVTFKYGLGDEFIEVLKTLHKLGLDRTEPVGVRGQQVSPRDVVAACLPDPATLGPIMSGKTCAGTWATGTGKDGNPREVYLYHVVDNEETWGRDQAQAVVWQTAINPVIALELLSAGAWSGAGVLGPEAFDAVPFLDLINEYGSPWGMEERTPSA